MKLFLATILTIAASASAQTLDLRLDTLSSRSSQKTEITLDGAALEKALKKSVGQGLTQVAVRNYEFKKAGDYADSDLNTLRQQIASSAGWKRVLDIKEAKERTEVYVLEPGSPNAQFLLIAQEPREVTVVHTVGPLDLGKLDAFVEDLVSHIVKAR